MDLLNITLGEFLIWGFGGVGASFVFYILAKKKESGNLEGSTSISASDSGGMQGSSQNKIVGGSHNSQAMVSVNIIPSESQAKLGAGKVNEDECERPSLEFRKNNTSILFIDDEVKFRLVKILQRSGWVHTKLIKDVESLDQDDVRAANIIFVDIQGVGIEMGFSEQGLGLASALKSKYPSKKIIIYSAEQTGDRFHKALREVDDSLPKDADPYQFQSMVEQYS